MSEWSNRHDEHKEAEARLLREFHKAMVDVVLHAAEAMQSPEYSAADLEKAAEALGAARCAAAHLVKENDRWDSYDEATTAANLRRVA